MATKKERSRLGKLSRTKGAAYERFVANVLKEVFPGARRGIGQARSGGDIPDVEGCGPLWVQTKHEKAPSIFAAMSQAEHELQMRRLQRHALSPYTTPVVIARRSSAPGDIAGMPLAYFVSLLVRAHELDKQIAKNKDQEETIEILRAQLGAASRRSELDGNGAR